MNGSIICGVDDSEGAKGASRVARDLSSKLGLRLVFVRVVKPGSPDEQISQIAERLEHLSECTTDVDCGAGWLVDVGHPVDRLVAAAAEEEASLIVVGSGGPRTSRIGSVSAEVSRRAKCPVVVVPPGADGHISDRVARLERESNGRHPTVTDGVDAPDLTGGLLRFSLDGQRTGS
jgi:nucleotide-binding universal stress UspA family protein